MSAITVKEFYIGNLKLEVMNDAYLVEVSFVEDPPHQDRVADLPELTLSSRNAIWFLRGYQSIIMRAKHGEKIREDLTSYYVQ